LKEVCLPILKRRITIFAGGSGSGESLILFDAIEGLGMVVAGWVRAGFGGGPTMRRS
jgi:hypothetical protein